MATDAHQSVTVRQPSAAELLTGPDAGDLLRVALREVGATVLSWRTNQVDHQPRRGSTAGYRVRVRWPDGRVSDERFAAYTGPAPTGALTLDDGTAQVAVWRFPHDPYLPALATAYDPAAVAGLLRSFAVSDGPVRLALRAYRPRRRAVVEVVSAGGARLFLKVVRPDQVIALHQRHRLLTGAGVPAPASLGHTPQGLLVLVALPGQTMRQALLGGARLPTGVLLQQLLDRLPAELLAQPPRRSWLARTGHYAMVVATQLPNEADRVRQLAAAIAAEAGTGPTVPVHGDFYENQLRVANGQVSGLLDFDTAGPGDRLDDLGCLLGHLSVLAQLRPEQAAAVSRLGADYLASFGRAVDLADLRYRAAAVVLSLATGPYRVQQPDWPRATRHRVELVERWVASARIVRR